MTIYRTTFNLETEEGDNAYREYRKGLDSDQAEIVTHEYTTADRDRYADVYTTSDRNPRTPYLAHIQSDAIMPIRAILGLSWEVER